MLAQGAERLDELTGGHGGAAAPPSPPALGRVRRRYPRLQVELITATRQLALRPSGFDPALVVGVPSSSRLVTEHLTDCTTSHWIRADHVSPRPPGRGRVRRWTSPRSRRDPSPMP
ncbi:MAG: hypothetical protein HOV97_07650 [Nonomuraea sp.]|nr:hypothetical protein [Nonomuraea sp.]